MDTKCAVITIIYNYCPGVSTGAYFGGFRELNAVRGRPYASHIRVKVYDHYFRQFATEVTYENEHLLARPSARTHSNAETIIFHTITNSLLETTVINLCRPRPG